MTVSHHHARLPTTLLLSGQALTMGSSTPVQIIEGHCLRSRQSQSSDPELSPDAEEITVKKRCCRFLPSQRATKLGSHWPPGSS